MITLGPRKYDLLYFVECNGRNGNMEAAEKWAVTPKSRSLDQLMDSAPKGEHSSPSCSIHIVVLS